RKGGWVFEQPVPRTLYKYYRPERVHVLRECSVRFSQRSAFDDERELRPEVAAFGTEEEIRVYMGFDPAFRVKPTWLKEELLGRMFAEKGWQERVTQIARSNVKAADEFGVFCLCEQLNSNEMWAAYAATKGFVVAFDTAHASFDSLRNPGKLGKVTYSDEPLGTFLGSYGPEAFFMKRAKYAFECEWRIIRALHGLERRGEHDGHPVLVAPFDPACVSEVLIRPECSVEQELRELLAQDDRYRHVALRRMVNGK
ncbi:MAG: DUF2971 domain-containing protein, partial [Candidatus Acidiferrales bacterium]